MKAVTIVDMKFFVGILALIEQVPYPRRKMYWEKDKDVYSTVALEAPSRN